MLDCTVWDWVWGPDKAEMQAFVLARRTPAVVREQAA